MWAEHAALLAQQPEEDRPVKPELLPWAEMPWRAWHQLTAERGHVLSGFAAPLGGMMLQSRPGPIPWSAIVAWADRAGLPDDEVDGFLLPLVAAMDTAYLEHWQQRQRRAAPAEVSDDKQARWSATPEER